MFNNNNCTFNSIGIKRKWYALLRRWKDWFHMWSSNVQISLELCPLLLDATLTHFIKTQQVDCILPFGFLNLLAFWTQTIIFSLFSLVSLLCSAFEQIPVWRFSEIKWNTHYNLGQVQIWVSESWSHCKEHKRLKWICIMCNFKLIDPPLSLFLMPLRYVIHFINMASLDVKLRSRLR